MVDSLKVSPLFIPTLQFLRRPRENLGHEPLKQRRSAARRRRPQAPRGRGSRSERTLQVKAPMNQERLALRPRRWIQSQPPLKPSWQVHLPSPRRTRRSRRRKDSRRRNKMETCRKTKRPRTPRKTMTAPVTTLVFVCLCVLFQPDGNYS